MRLLQVIDSVHAADGGPVEIVVQTCCALQRRGDEAEILVARAPDAAARERLAGIAIHWAGTAIGRYGYSAAARRWLRENVARFDAVVIHGVWQYGPACAAAAARARGVPYFVYPHGTLDIALPEMHPFRHAKKRVYWRLVARSLLEDSAAVCFTGEYERDRARAFPGRWNAIVVGVGIDVPRAGQAQPSLAARFPAIEGKRVVLYLGRLHPLKGVDTLIRAFARARHAAPGCRLLIAGQGAPRYRRRMAGLANALGCGDDVIFAGVLDAAQKWAALEAAELFVLPSHRDSFGVAVVEALATGTPVVVTRAVGVAPIVERYGAGIVCEDREDDLAGAIERALRDATDSGRAAAARRCYLENFRGEDAAARLTDAILRARAAARPIS